MKTKNTRVRAKDVKYGRILYIAHPFFGIEKVTVISKPYLNKCTNSLFVNGVKHYMDYLGRPTSYTGDRSLRDAGIIKGEGYNDRRTFFKLKHAEDWVRLQSTDPSKIKRHKKHMEECARMNEYMGEGY